MNIVALTRYGCLGASSRVRTYQYLPFFDRAGSRVTVHSLLGDDYLRRRYSGERVRAWPVVRAYLARVVAVLGARRSDVVWIEKELLPWMPALAERLLLAGVPYVLDYDDAIFHCYDQHPKPVVRRLLGRKIDRIMRGAALVVVGNDYLARRALEAGSPRVEIVPSAVDLRRYGEVEDLPGGPFTVGWIGSPGSERLLDSFRPVLTDLARDPDIRLVLIGASGSALNGIPHQAWRWSLETEIEQLRQLHVGIMPLGDTGWEQGKCGYKLIQYMAAGRSVVASPVGVNTVIVEDGVSGFLASSFDDWKGALKALKDDRGLCARQGRAGRRRVEQRYNLLMTAPRIIDLLRSVGNDRRR